MTVWTRYNKGVAPDATWTTEYRGETLQIAAYDSSEQVEGLLPMLNHYEIVVAARGTFFSYEYNCTPSTRYETLEHSNIPQWMADFLNEFFRKVHRAEYSVLSEKYIEERDN